MTPTSTPVEITVDGGAGYLDLLWGNGHRTRISIRQLRDACRCADCERLRRRAAAPVASPGIGIRDVEIYGVGALRLHFSDGHDRGLYPWRYLLELASGASTCKPNHSPNSLTSTGGSDRGRM